MKDYRIRVTAPGGMSMIIKVQSTSLAGALSKARERTYNALSDLGFSLPDEYRISAAVVL